jgi:2-aminobenzoate-CoA ligase
MMSADTAHIDTFARDNLPPRVLWPEFSFDLPELQYAERLNCATELLDRAVARGLGDRPVFYTHSERWTYGELLERANRIARVLRDDFGLLPGNRVLLRAANNPMLVACWFAVLKAGGIAVTTMPLLRARELAVILDKARIGLALCDQRLADELEQARTRAPVCARICYFARARRSSPPRRTFSSAARRSASPSAWAAWSPSRCALAPPRSCSKRRHPMSCSRPSRSFGPASASPRRPRIG